MQKILVALDFSDLTDLVIEKTIAIAQAFGASVRLLHVAAPDPAFASSKGWPQEVRDEFARELQAEHRQLQQQADALQAAGIDAKAILARGPVVETLLEYVRKSDVDLIVLGAHKHGAFFELLERSVVKGIIRKANCPVIVIPEPLPENA